MIGRQLPVYSPLAAHTLLRAAMGAVVHPDEGPARLARFLSERYGAREVLLTSSGTHALQLGLALATAAKPWRGTVALPAYTCFDVATAALGARVPVTFYDVDPSNLCPDGEGIRAALAAGARVVVANGLYGFPLDWGWLRAECREAGALLVEDAAQASGSTWDGRPGGSFGDLTVLSFGRGKGWTGGGGGALLLRDGFLEGAGGDPLHAGLGTPGRLRDVRTLGVSLAQWALGRPSLFWIPAAIPSLAIGETVYKEPSRPQRMGALSSAVALATSEASEREAGCRGERAACWRALHDEGLTSARGGFVAPSPLEGGRCGYLRFPILARPPRTSARVLSGRALSAGLAPGYPKPLPELPALRERVVGAPPTRGAAELAIHLFTIPTHSRLRPRDTRVVREVLGLDGERSA